MTRIWALDLKIIYLLRNPIHRLWSHANIPIIRQNFWKIVQNGYTEDRFCAWYLQNELHQQHSNYLSNLQVWEAIYPKEQIFIGFFEQLSREPNQLLRAIFDFLAIDTDEQYIPASVFQKQNKGPNNPIPPRWATYLSQHYYEQLKLLHARFNNDSTASWLKEAEQTLNKM